MKPECKRGLHQMVQQSVEPIYKKYDWNDVPKPIGTRVTFKCKHCDHETHLDDKPQKS